MRNRVLVSIAARLRTWGPHPEVRILPPLFAASALIAMVYTATWGGTPQFWQNTTFTQGLMWVCGHGFENPRVSQIPGLEDFLDSRTDCFDCGAIPKDVDILPHDTSGMTFEEIDAYHPQPQFPSVLPWQRYHLYLVLAVTGCWYLFGVCWSALTPLCGLLYGLTVAASYGLFRLAMRRGLAVFFAIVVMTSPLHLQMVPHLRDYAKAPFVLLCLFLMGCLIKLPLGRWGVVLLSMLCGAIAGLGIGFRTDVGIVVPAFVIVALAFLPGSFWKTLPRRFAAVALFFGVFVLTGYPILVEVFRESGHFCHVALLGLLDYCDERLGVGAVLYQLGGPYSDFYVANVVQSYVQRTHGFMPPTHVMMPEYHAATQLFLAEYIRTFPGDFVFRAYASVLRVLDELHINPQHPYPMGITNHFLERLFDLRAAVVDRALAGGRYFAAAALILLACRNLRFALGTFFLLLYFGGYPAIQFNTRHAFYLEFMSMWAAGFLIQQMWFGLRRAASHRPQVWMAGGLGGAREQALRGLTFLVVACLGLTLPLAATWGYQRHTVGRLLERVTGHPLDPVPWQPAADPAQPGLLLTPDLGRLDTLTPKEATLPVQSEYVAVELKGGADAVPVTFCYQAEDKEHFDYTRTVIAPPGAGPVRLYFPLYYSPESRFTGLRIPPAQQDRLLGLYLVRNASDIPLWMTLTLPPDWRALPRHQGFTR
jgi:hypothetical protein